MTVLVVQHLPHEHAGVLGEVLARAGVSTVTWRAWAQPEMPGRLQEYRAVAVLGGDMFTDESDRWPHLNTVRDLLRKAVQADIPSLCLCLGAQLLAEACGGRVSHGTPEIGYIPITLTPSGRRDPVVSAVADGTSFFNADADQIHLPSQATLLAFSAATAVHAFRVGAAVGLQYHPEIDASFVAAYVEAPGVREYLQANDWTGEELLRQARLLNIAHRAAGQSLFAAWLDGVATRR